jgi:hypothetical protein
MMNSCSAKIPSILPWILLSFGYDCSDLRIYPESKTCGWQLLNLSLGNGRIWYRKVWVAIILFLEICLSCYYLIPRDTWILEIYIFENIKLSHDEFLYDESFNSYHSHIYMIARLGKPAHRLLVLCWVWSTRVRPLSRGWSCPQDQENYTHNLHPCYFYSGSTHHHIHPFRSTQKCSTPTLGVNTKNISHRFPCLLPKFPK